MAETIFQNKIETLLPHIHIRLNEPMWKHTSFRIGGPVEVMAFPQNPSELAEILKVSKLLDGKTAILGAGTNILAPDEGISGLVICLKDSLSGMEQIDETHVWIASGVTMSRAAVFAAGIGLSGMEFSHGIPGTIGGGVYMNAGAYGGEIRSICESVDVMYMDGTTCRLSAEEMDFSYRHSCLEEKQGIVLGATFALTPMSQQEIKAKMAELMEKRKTSQPLDKPSAGSAFKRPSVGYAAALIDECGLKGFRVGNAAVSQKHAGFVVNLGNATAEDVRSVLQQVAQKVQKDKNIQLEPEIRIW